MTTKKTGKFHGSASTEAAKKKQDAAIRRALASGYPRVVFSMACGAAEEGSAGVPVWTSVEKSAARRLEKLRLVRTKKTGEKLAGLSELLVTLTEHGARVHLEREAAAHATPAG